MYQLGDLILKNPVNFVRKQIELSGANTTLTNRTTKDILGRKEQFILTFQNLTQTQVNNLLAEWNLQTTRNFTVNETSLTIPATPVHIDIQQRNYIKGGDYREIIILTLTEVS